MYCSFVETLQTLFLPPPTAAAATPRALREITAVLLMMYDDLDPNTIRK